VVVNWLQGQAVDERLVSLDMLLELAEIPGYRGGGVKTRHFKVILEIWEVLPGFKNSSDLVCCKAGKPVVPAQAGTWNLWKSWVG